MTAIVAALIKAGAFILAVMVGLMLLTALMAIIYNLRKGGIPNGSSNKNISTETPGDS